MQSLSDPSTSAEIIESGAASGTQAAIQAWSAFAREAVSSQVEVLKDKNKSKVYRLRRVSGSGSTVIAKWCRSETARLEKLIYDEVIAQTPGPFLSCYGLSQDAGADFCWLFLEDALGRDYSPRHWKDRALSARWLGWLHAQSLPAALTEGGNLPRRTPDHYLEVLRSSRTLLLEHQSNRFLPPEDVATLQSIAAQYDFLEAHWRELSEPCELGPCGLVHGDLVIKNLRVREEGSSPALLVFDWENAGWGVPATDLAQVGDRAVTPDLAVYADTLNLRSALSSLRRVGDCGRIFRLLDSVRWAALMLVYQPYDWLSTPASYLKVYESRLSEAFVAFGWRRWKRN